MKKLLLLLALVVVCTFKANTQVVAEWNCDNTVIATSTNPLFVSAASNISVVGAGGLGYPIGCPGSATDRSASWNNWPLIVPFLPTSYIEISITVSQNVNLEWLRLSTNRTINGPTDWHVRWSLDTYATPLYSNNTSLVGCNGHSINLGGIFLSSGQTVTFRLHAGGGTQSSGRWNVEDVQFEVSGSTLPITLTSFTGEVSGDASVLRWTTVSESNNSHFTLFRSSDMFDWKEIGTLPGAGTSVQVLGYSFSDQNPDPGDNYYRLRQTDFDGNFEESWVVVVHHKERLRGVIHNVGDVANLPGERSTLFSMNGSIVSPHGENHNIQSYGVFTLVGEHGTRLRIVVE